MENFDPAAATAAYLATFSPAQTAKAIAYTQGGYWLILGGLVVSLVIAFILARSNLLVRLHERIEGSRRRPILASIAVGAAFIASTIVLILPWLLYVGWWREKQYGLSNQTWLQFLGEFGMMALIILLVGTLAIAALYAVIRRTGRAWPIWGAGVGLAFSLAGMVLSPILIEPLFNHYTPAPAGAVRDTVVDLAHRTGTPSDKIFIYDGTRQSDRYTANVSGLFGSARVAMSDAMFKKDARLDEVRGVVGHEMGHYVHWHGLIGAGFSFLLALLTYWLADRLFPAFRRLLGAERVRDISDPAGLPVLFAVISVIQVLATPLSNTVTRLMESDADHFSMVYANEPDGMAKALIKTAEYRAPSPTPLEEFFFYDHPSVENRIRAAMEWKAAHMPGAAPAPAVAPAAEQPNTDWPPRDAPAPARR